jgi:glycosyltransferase involved in cell wall biosynthesis
MRVLYINPFTQQLSGADESLISLISLLGPRGVESHLLLPGAGPLVPRYESLGVRVHFGPFSILKRRLAPASVALLPVRAAVGVAAIARLVRRERIDLVHTNMEVVLDGGVATRLLRIPHVLHYRGNTLDQPKQVFDVLTRLWTATSDRILCISKGTADIFGRRGLGAKVEALYDPVDVSFYARAERSTEVRGQLGAGGEDVLVGSVARIHPRKDLETFLRAAALIAPRFPRLKVALVGAAEVDEELAYRVRLQTLARELGIADRVCFAGARCDVPAVLAALDVAVLSSRHEGFGRAVVEAMAAGRPLVVSREGALPELVTHGVEGLCATAADPKDFAAKLSTVLGDAALRERMGVAARERARGFEPGKVAAHVVALYRQLLGTADHFPGIVSPSEPG